MRPWFAGPLAGLAGGPAWWLGTVLAGVAAFLVRLLGGLVGLSWLARPAEALALLAVPPVVVGALYTFLAHGPEPSWTGGLVGASIGALVLSAGLLTGALPLLPALLAPVALGAVGGLAGLAGGGARAERSRP